MSGSPIQYVTLVSGGGTPIRLADQSGTPYPTTGYGAIVFSLNPTLNGATFTGPVIFDEGRLGFMLGSAAQPSIYFGDIANKDGFFSAGPGHVNTAIGGMPIVDVSASGLNVAGNVTFSGTLAGVIPTPLTTRGDIYYRGESGNTRLPLGSPGYVLGSNGIDAAWTAVGSGTITSIASGVGIVTTPDPITATGSIALATNGVVAGSYGGTTNSVQLTVDVYGRITTIINAAIPLASYLPLTGGTLVGPLTGTTATMSGNITTNGGSVVVDRIGDAVSANLTVAADAAFTAGITFNGGVNSRWILRKNATAEGGSNTGSDFEIVPRNDAGGALPAAMTITRSTGAVTLTGTLTGTTATFTTSVDTGALNLTGLLTGAQALFSGNVSTVGNLAVRTSTAIAAGSNTQAFIKASATANFGIYYGTGAPSFSAAKGSLYTNTTATTTTTRVYVNTDGSTTWATVTTSA